MFTLPDVPGPYAVGATTFAVPVSVADDSSRTIGDARLKASSGSSPYAHALRLEEVAFTAFYPADIHSEGAKNAKHKMAWIPSLATRWNRAIVKASRGNVVLALEHRDGTGPFVLTRSLTPGVKDKVRPDSKLYIKPDDVTYPEGGTKGRFAFRDDQLLFRRLELYIAYTYFRNLTQFSGELTSESSPLNSMHTVDGPWSIDSDKRPQDKAFWNSWTKTNSLKVQCDEDIILAGHSFGGATVLSILSHPPPTLGDERFSSIPITRAIAFDPWLEPLPSPGPQPSHTEPSSPREPPILLVVNSEGFTLWDDHFTRLKDIVKCWNGASKDHSELVSGRRAQLVTVARSKHVSFSDFGVILPFGQMARDGRKFLDTMSNLAIGWVEDRFDESLQQQKKASGATEWVNAKGDKKGKRRFVADVGDIIVH
ncbi:hypothetical protein PHLCEN_2v9383 [Hermanssonia centrifuga]|uniref:1-alkyl-2-acetylglycerophosphocholine esterase n=1 Tax=Hermanssonia centrifuga TaxID=98765 RepID=A0A2R6NQU2_9APHY|nr:hypothetical protein PHLCEN_2v9383 [Hermanssonia centrifuga]